MEVWQFRVFKNVSPLSDNVFMLTSNLTGNPKAWQINSTLSSLPPASHFSFKFQPLHSHTGFHITTLLKCWGQSVRDNQDSLHQLGTSFFSSHYSHFVHATHRNTGTLYHTTATWSINDSKTNSNHDLYYNLIWKQVSYQHIFFFFLEFYQVKLWQSFVQN